MVVLAIQLPILIPETIAERLVGRWSIHLLEDVNMITIVSSGKVILQTTNRTYHGEIAISSEESFPSSESWYISTFPDLADRRDFLRVGADGVVEFQHFCGSGITGGACGREFRNITGYCCEGKVTKLTGRFIC